jgi:tetratricopeptide (TPR) repeat protein
MILALALGWFAYAPGLKGSFLFDDAANLPSLGATGPIDSFSTLARYLTSGHADPTGRPLSVASFLIDARDWPASPYPFKRTSLLIHLLNGALLFIALRKLGRAAKLDSPRSDWAAAIAASLWLLHPLFVSTVLYVVQREAMLPATFALLAILCSLCARTSCLAGRSRASVAWLIMGVGGFTALAFLSKANGALIPLLVLIIHATLPPLNAPPNFRRALIFFLAPLAALPVAYVLWMAVANIGAHAIPIRGWSVSQRLMTEPSIVVDYLRQLWLLKTTDSSLLHDDVRVATSLTSPWYTSVNIGLLLFVAVGAWAGRRRYPAIALAALFFLGGHLMESSSLALELYFEHRNYLPSMMMFWPIGLILTRAGSSVIASIGAIATASLFAALTYANASLWGHPLNQAEAWADAHPGSARAQTYAAQLEASSGHSAAARHRIDEAAERFRGEPQVALSLLDIHCAGGGVSVSDLGYATDALRDAQREPGPLLLNWFDQAAKTARSGNCAGLDREVLTRLLDAADSNPRISAIAGRRQDVLHARGALALAWGDADETLDLFDQALALEPTPAAALSQAAELGRAGFPSHGLSHLRYFSSLAPLRAHTWRDGMPWIHDKVLDGQNYWPQEVEHLRQALTSAVRDPET